MRKTLFFIASIICLAGFMNNIYAQDNEVIHIAGKIIDAETEAPVSYVHVVNKTTGKGTVSNADGRFSIQITPVDTLLFSAIGFESYAFSLDKKIPENKLQVVIKMNTSTMELQPVNIFAYKDEYALKRALIEMDVPLETNEQFNSGWVPSKKSATDGGIAIGGPISALYNSFSREGKEKRKLEKYQQEYEFRKSLMVKYNEDIVKELTGLPENKVVEFMNFCKLDDGFLNRANAYEIAVAVNHCFTEFIELDSIPTEKIKP